MSDRTHDSVNCESISGAFIEFALGTISGRRRSLVLEHLETCPHWQSRVGFTGAVTDALLLLAPEIEPPLGFESGLSRGFLKDEPRAGARAESSRYMARRRRPARRVVGFGVGNCDDSWFQPDPLRCVSTLTARLTSSGVVLGQVIVTPGKPSWIVHDCG